MENNNLTNENEKNLTSSEGIKIDTTIEGIKVNKEGKEYVSNPFLFKEIMRSKEQDELTNDAVQMLLLMIENISAKKTYKDKEVEKDCKQQAMLDCLQYWRGFDPEKSNNPFAYFTSVITNGLAKGWNAFYPQNKQAPGAIFTSIDNNIYSI